MTAGRPTKYTPEMCDRVIAVGREGGIVPEMAIKCDASTQALYDWCKVHPEFLEAFTRAQELAELFWHERIKAGLTLPPAEFQGAANLKYMAQRFRNWREKQDIDMNVNADVTSRQITADMTPEQAAQIYAEKYRNKA